MVSGRKAPRCPDCGSPLRLNKYKSWTCRKCNKFIKNLKIKKKPRYKPLSYMEQKKKEYESAAPEMGFV